jgi:hypothetical protein
MGGAGSRIERSPGRKLNQRALFEMGQVACALKAQSFAKKLCFLKPLRFQLDGGARLGNQ